MRVCSIVVLALLAFLALVDAKALNQKQAELLKRANDARDGVLRVVGKEYDALLNGPREYSVSVLYTVSPSLMPCAACDMVSIPYSEVGRGWKKHPQHGRHVLALLDAANTENRQTFLRLKMHQVPALRHFPATTGPYATENTDPVGHDLLNGMTADDLAAGLSSFLQTKVKAYKPLFTPLTFGIAAGTVAIVLTAVFIVPSLDIQGGARGIAMIICVLLVITFTSGQMWTRIRNPPFVMRSQEGVQYLASGFMSQNGVETVITSSLYGALTILTVVLAKGVPQIRSKAVQNVVLAISAGGVLFMFSLLINVFTQKM